MLRIVLDTNIYISALHFKSSLPRKILLLAISGKFQQIVSKELLAEIRGVLTTKFHYDTSHLEVLEALLLESCEVVDPSIRISVVSRDPDDNMILECAVAGKADCIVSGDYDLVQLKAYKEIPILTAREFLEKYIEK